MSTKKRKVYSKISNHIAKDLRTPKYQMKMIPNKKRKAKNDPRFDRRSWFE